MSQHTDEIPHTSFREVAREYYIPTVHYQPDNTATVYDELENELLTRSNKMTREENFNNGPHGIYTEGGLVVVPDEETTPDEGNVFIIKVVGVSVENNNKIQLENLKS